MEEEVEAPIADVEYEKCHGECDSALLIDSLSESPSS